jgi:hypothetical protein
MKRFLASTGGSRYRAASEEELVNRRIFALAALLLAGCSPSKSAYLTAAYRFGEADRSVLLVSAPREAFILRLHSTLAGPEETGVESTPAPIDLSDVAQAWGFPTARALRLFRDAPVVLGGVADPFVRRLAVDPRRAGEPGYRLLPPYREPPPTRDPLGPPPSGEADLDGSWPRSCLVRAEIPVDNLPAPLWFAFDPDAVARRFDVKLMLLVAVERIAVIDEPPRPRVTVRLGAHLVDLETPLLAVSAEQDIDVTRAEGPAGVEASQCRSFDELRAENWRALRQSLLRLGDRYGFLLAQQLGWINPDRLAEEAARWQAENDLQLK